MKVATTSRFLNGLAGRSGGDPPKGGASDPAHRSRGRTAAAGHGRRRCRTPDV